MYMQKVFTHKPSIKLEELDVTYQDGSRFYLSPNGEKYPSVTTVTGWEKNQFFAKWRAENPKESKRILCRGNQLHDLIERYLKNENIELLEESPVVATLFSQMKDTLNNIDNIYALEAPLWSKTLKLAGRVDCVAEYDGKISIIDFKGSTKQKRKQYIENYMLQSTAYAIMYHEMTGVPINEFHVIVSAENGMPCKVFSGDPMDYVPRLHETIKKFREQNNYIVV